MKKKFLLCVISSCLALALCGSPAARAARLAPTIDRQTIAAGEGFTAVIKENGDLYTFGKNSDGELGNGFIYDNSEYKCLMTPMKMMSGVAAVYAGTSNCCAITESGSLYCWGSNEFGEVGNGEVCNGKPSAACGRYQTTPYLILSGVLSAPGANSALKSNGDLYMWGFNGSGQLGNNFVGNVKSGFTWAGSYQTVPIKVMSNVAKVSSGANTTSMIMNNGDLYMCGSNKFYQIGDNSSDAKSADGASCKPTPYKVMSNISSVALGYYHTGAVTKDGDLYIWGNNHYGRLGDGTFTDRYTPKKILSGVKKAAFGAENSMALLENGDLYTWGDNDYGQAGNGVAANHSASYTANCVMTPTKIMSGVIDISCCCHHCIALLNNGDLYGWGMNISGCLGTGDTKDRCSPYKIMSGVRLPSPAQSFANGALPNIAIDGYIVSFDNNYGWPYINGDSRTMVPFAATMLAYGVSVSWDGKTGTASAYNSSTRVDVPIGQKYIVVNGVKQEIDTSAAIVNSRTYLPIAAVLQAFGAAVKWDGTAHMVEVTRPQA